MVVISPQWLCFSVPQFRDSIRPSFRQPIHGRTRLKLGAVGKSDLLPEIRQGLLEAGAAVAWEDTVAVLSDVAGMKSEEAELALAKALEWRAWAICSSAMMRKYMKPKMPDAEAVRGALTWLSDGPLALDGDAIRDAVLNHPEAYLVDPEKAYGMALACAPDKYKDPSDFRARLLDDSSVLGCTYNCAEDGCASECGNCWVSYGMR